MGNSNALAENNSQSANRPERINGKFAPGFSGNPSSKPRPSISKIVRQQEFRRAFKKLIDIREGRIREMDFVERGKRIWVYPSVSNLITACVKIMEYTAGKPEQKISLDVIGEAEKPNALQIVLSHANEAATPENDQGIMLERPKNVRVIEEKPLNFTDSKQGSNTDKSTALPESKG